MSSKTKTIVLVTGANKTIGYETVKALLESDKPYHVFLGSRSLERGQEAVATLQKECTASSNTVQVLQLDVSSDSSIEKAFETVKASVGRLDVLINNAGITKDLDATRGKTSLRDSLTGTYDVNVAGAHVTSSTFVPLLLQSADARLIFVAGLGGMDRGVRGDHPQPADLESQRGAWPKKTDFETLGYRCSKTALNLLMLDYHSKLRHDGVKVWCVGPGFLVTDLGGNRELIAKMGGGHPSLGGRMMKSVVEGERDADVGKLINKDGVLPF